MSRFTFIHAADLHLGTRFHGLATRDEATARHFAEATRTALGRLVDRTIEAKAAFLLLAGDIYDGEWQDLSTGLDFASQMARLAREDIPVFTLRGNHDALSIVRREITLPDNVKEFSTEAPETVELDELRVAIHGQGFAERSCPENLASRYPPPRAGWFNIGLLHTSLDGRPGHGSYAPCTPADLVARGYDYWALGHSHAFEMVSESDPMIVYPGNLQGRSIREQGGKGAVSVTVEDGRIIGAAERLIVDGGRFFQIAIDIDGMEDVPDLWSRLSERFADAVEQKSEAVHAARIVISGKGSIHDALVAMGNDNRTAEAQAAADRQRDDIRIEKVVLRSAPATGRHTDRLAEDGFDLETLLSSAAADPDVQDKIAEAMAQIGRHMTGGADHFQTETGAILAEARATLLARAEEE
ncbi:DNA repair exonuclease [Notoacmeibacter sp. MSK16QG-6]|uniref:metallophosphoesterase family protein n=1 Tax=Notoacmeibacter sp. MSK16QG-6 TaxID=2957982 RepID=UPI00209E6841|nr:DNA repair exonuclease [Notoacmeibacter sp. MSK16QG-6]MCP1198539.1 DNA repair exonuclease [Notoacmeibacter sp. MSK16QG-6]